MTLLPVPVGRHKYSASELSKENCHPLSLAQVGSSEDRSNDLNACAILLIRMVSTKSLNKAKQIGD